MRAGAHIELITRPLPIPEKQNEAPRCHRKSREHEKTDTFTPHFSPQPTKFQKAMEQQQRPLSASERGASRRGFLPVGNGFFDLDFWNEKRVYNRSEAWLDLIHMAAHNPTRRGTVDANSFYLAERWDWTLRRTRWFINLLKKKGMVTTETSATNGRRLFITLTNFDRYNPSAATGAREGGNVQGRVQHDVQGHVTQPAPNTKGAPGGDVQGHVQHDVQGHVHNINKKNNNKNTPICSTSSVSDGRTPCGEEEEEERTKSLTPKIQSNGNKQSLFAGLPDGGGDGKDNRDGFEDNTDNTDSRGGGSDNKDNARAVDPERFRAFFNRTLDEAGSVIPRVRARLSAQRLAYLRQRVEQYGREAAAEVVRRAARSPFLNGRTGAGFRPDFTWLFRPNNFPKVLDGYYDERYGGGGREDNRDNTNNGCAYGRKDNTDNADNFNNTNNNACGNSNGGGESDHPAPLEPRPDRHGTPRAGTRPPLGSSLRGGGAAPTQPPLGRSGSRPLDERHGTEPTARSWQDFGTL